MFPARSTYGDMKQHLGKSTFKLTIPVPDVEGEWFYQPKITYNCPERDTTIQQLPALILVYTP